MGISFENIKRTVPYKKKIANDFAEQKEKMKLYSMYYLDGDKDRAKRIQTNYGLLNGIVSDEDYNAPLDLILEGDAVSLGYPYMHHFPHISKIAETALGEEILTPLALTVRDSSKGKNNAKKRQQVALIREYLYNVHIKPLDDRLMAPIIAASQSGTMDDAAIQELIAKAQEQIKIMTPKEIKEYIENDFKSSLEIFGQDLLSKLNEYCDLKNKKVDGMEDVLAIAEVYYLPSINHNYPSFKVVNPEKVHVIYSPTSPFAQDGVAAVITDDVTVQEAFAEDGEYFTKKDIAKLTNQLHTYGYRKDRSQLTPYEEQVIFEAHVDPNFSRALSGIDLDTQDGQDDLVNLYSSVVRNINHAENGMYLTRSYITWRDMAYFQRVKRRDLNTGVVDYYWEAEHYTLNPLRGDISSLKVEKPEVWHGVMYGYGDDAVFCKVEPIPNQYISLENIHQVYLPIFGGRLNTRKQNTENKSPVDFGKVWNYEFDLLMAEYKLKQASNIGNVFVLFKELKPDDIPWGEWMTTLKYMKILLLTGTNDNSSINPNLVQYLKGVDMSTINELAGIINMLGYFQKQVADSMGFSPERMGNIGQYMTATNAQGSVNASQTQTARIFHIHNYIFLEAVKYLFNITRTALKNNKYLRDLFLDDIGQAITSTDWELIDSSQLGIFFSMSASDIVNLKEIKARTQEIIQNQMLTIDDLFTFMFSETPSELRNLGISISKKREEAMASQQKADDDKVKQMIAAENERFQKEFEGKVLLQKMADASDERNVIVDSMKFANTLDINKNEVSDSYEIAMEKLKFEREKFNKEQSGKERELTLKERELNLREKELEQAKKEGDKGLELEEKSIEVAKKQKAAKKD